MTQWMRAEGNIWVLFLLFFGFAFSLTTITSFPLKDLFHSSAHHILFFSLYPELASPLGLGSVAFGICSHLHRMAASMKKNHARNFCSIFFAFLFSPITMGGFFKI
ncbi:hypothetical protein V8C43DRAFT_233398 [Trichoderma afarasin]